MNTLFRVTAPADYPIMLSEVKRQAKVTLDSEDDLIVLAMDAAVNEMDGANGYLGRCLITQTWELRLDDFRDTMKIPLPPLQSVSSVKYIDTNGTEQTLATTVYDVLTNPEPGIVRLANSQTWPTVRREKDAVRIRFVAGYGASGLSVPELIRQRLLIRAATFYEHRDELFVGHAVMPSPFVDSMLENFRIRDAW